MVPVEWTLAVWNLSSAKPLIERPFNFVDFVEPWSLFWGFEKMKISPFVYNARFSIIIKKY